MLQAALAKYMIKLLRSASLYHPSEQCPTGEIIHAAGLLQLHDLLATDFECSRYTRRYWFHLCTIIQY